MTLTEIVAVGNELLQGDVLDTNTHWLCRQLTGRGVRVGRAAMVPDNPEVISEAVHEALDRRPDLLLLTGGLGPTADDLTLGAVAQALDRPLQLDNDALGMLEATYQGLAERGLVKDGGVTDARRKMAYLPRGAEPLANAVGAAPGVLIQIASTTVVCLPGVPEELKSIFRDSLCSRLASLMGDQVFEERVLVTDCGDESVLAPVVDAVAERHQKVYVKSRARAYGEGVQLKITLSATGPDRHSVREAMDAAGRDLVEGLADAGVAILVVEEELSR